MNKNNKNTNEDQAIPPTSYKFYLGSRERYIYINCEFEAANIQVVRQMSEFIVSLKLCSIGSTALMMDSKLATGSILKVGSISVCMDFLKIRKGSL
jgi:hypothetical protein